MAFALAKYWVWDYWLADDGALFHLYYLRAPKSLGDPDLRHRNARIGHASSSDLSSWVDHGEVLAPGASGDFDETATWTGSVVRGPDDHWWMFYTGARFDASGNTQAIGIARSTDLHEWVKVPGVVVEADPRWYERRGDSAWPEESWRDPWVFRDDSTGRWHMLVTARAGEGEVDNRGVIGHARSSDLLTWEVAAPLSEHGAGFAHLEVPQVTSLDGSNVLVFSCNSPALSSERLRTRSTGGIWTLPITDAVSRFDIASAHLTATESLYSGRLFVDRSGQSVMLAFRADSEGGDFVGSISDPIPVRWNAERTGVELVIEGARE